MWFKLCPCNICFYVSGGLNVVYTVSTQHLFLCFWGVECGLNCVHATFVFMFLGG